MKAGLAFRAGRSRSKEGYHRVVQMSNKPMDLVTGAFSYTGNYVARELL
jgi:hypothetical protein